MFERHNWGYAVQNSADNDEIVDKMARAFSDRSRGIKANIANQFHLDWPQAVLSDMITLEKRRLLRDYGKFYQGDPVWDMEPKKVSNVVDINALKGQGVTVSSKVIGGVSLAAAVASAIAAVVIAVPGETKAKIQDDLRDSLKLTKGSGSCIGQEETRESSCVFQDDVSEKDAI